MYKREHPTPIDDKMDERGKHYDFHSIENLALVILWDFVYKA